MKLYMVGDPIAYNTSRNYTAACFIHFDTVDKIYKNGLLTANGKRFNLRGKEVTTKINQFPSATLMDVEYARQIIFDDTRRKADRRLVQECSNLLEKTSKRLTDEKRKAIEALVEILKKEED